MNNDDINIISEIEKVISILDNVHLSMSDFTKSIINFHTKEFLTTLETKANFIYGIIQNDLESSYTKIKRFCSAQTMVPLKYEVKNIILESNKPFISSFYPSSKLFAFVRAKGFKTSGLMAEFKIIGSKKKRILLGLSLTVKPIISEYVVLPFSSLPLKASLVKTDYSFEPIPSRAIATIEKILTPDSLFMIGFNVKNISADDIGKEGFIKLYDILRVLKNVPQNIMALEISKYPVDHLGINFDIFVREMNFLLQPENYDRQKINELTEAFLEAIESEKARLLSLFKRLKISNIF